MLFLWCFLMVSDEDLNKNLFIKVFFPCFSACYPRFIKKKLARNIFLVERCNKSCIYIDRKKSYIYCTVEPFFKG